MSVLFVVGLGEGDGKTAIALGLAARWQQMGKPVGYIKAFLTHDLASPEEGDVTLAGSILGAATMVSLASDDAGGRLRQTLSQPELAAPLAGGVALVEVAEAVTQHDHDSRLVDAIAAVQGRALVVASALQALGADSLLQAVEPLKEQLIGIMVNRIPQRRIEHTKRELEARLSGEGITVLGVLPESRPLYGFTVGELAEHLRAEYLCHADKGGLLIENVMLGGNPPDPAYNYFAPKPAKAVFCRSDRPDIQHAALDAEPRCLVLTGQGRVLAAVLHRSEDMGIPVLRVNEGTIDTITSLDGLVAGQRFRQTEKVAMMRSLLEAHLDLGVIDNALNLA